MFLRLVQQLYQRLLLRTHHLPPDLITQFFKVSLCLTVETLQTNYTINIITTCNLGRYKVCELDALQQVANVGEKNPKCKLLCNQYCLLCRTNLILLANSSLYTEIDLTKIDKETDWKKEASFMCM